MNSLRDPIHNVGIVVNKKVLLLRLSTFEMMLKGVGTFPDSCFNFRALVGWKGFSMHRGGGSVLPDPSGRLRLSSKLQFLPYSSVALPSRSPTDS